ncbi:MAG: family 16 glycosylhydrolase [Beutenbergiaceae bacterium]
MAEAARFSAGRKSLARFTILALLAGTVLLAKPFVAPATAVGDQLIASDATWSYWRDSSAPAPGWQSESYDDSDWSQGQAPLGFGRYLAEDDYATRLPDLSGRTTTTYFRHSFDVDIDQRPTLSFQTWADDGVVVFVNGVEVGRDNVSERYATITHDTVWATDAPRAWKAKADPLTITIPPDLLHEGANQVAVAVLSNWRRTSDVTFGGELAVAAVDPVAPDPTEPALDPETELIPPDLTTPPTDPSAEPSEPAPPSGSDPEPPTDSDPEPPSDPVDAPDLPQVPESAPVPTGAIVDTGSTWEYYRSTAGPAPTWKYSTSSQGWATAKAPFGYGTSLVATQLPASGRPLNTYARVVFTIDDLNAGLLREGASLTTWADDGIIVYVNGVEVGRARVDEKWAGEHDATWALDAPSSATAQKEPVNVTIPGDVLQLGANVLAVQVVSNYSNTRDISFDAQLLPGGGAAPLTDRYVVPNSSWELAWSDEFDGNALDTSNWSAYNLSTYGDGNLEAACLMNRPENLSVRDGYLHLTARQESQPIQCGDYDTRYPDGREFTSAQILSRDKMEFMYGRIEIRAQLPVAQGTSQGLWPAFWLRSSDSMGEIDILEALGSGAGDNWQAGVVYHSLHESTMGDRQAVRTSFEVPRGADLSEGFHTYALEWEPDEIRFFIDGVMTARYTSAEVPWISDVFTNHEFFVRLNLAVGGRWPGYVTSDTELPASYVIDYVRLYQAQ